jgi:hypothetical protein
LPEVVRNGQTLWGYDTAEYIEDVGTPLRLQETERDMLSGKIARLNRKNPRGAVFLRQINVLTTDIQPEAPVESLQLLPHVAEAVHQINVSEYLTFVLSDLQEPVASNVADEPRPTNGQPENRPQISDQPIINNVDINNALGYAKFDTLLGAKRAFVDHIYDGLSSATKNACISALLGQAAADWNVDLEQSWMIGCRLTDLEVAARSGCRTILLRNGRAPFDARDRKNLYRPDFICNDLAQAVPLLLQNEKAPLS